MVVEVHLEVVHLFRSVFTFNIMHGSHVGVGTPNNGHVWDEKFSLKLKSCLRKVFLLCLVHRQDSLIFFPGVLCFGWVRWYR